MTSETNSSKKKKKKKTKGQVKPSSIYKEIMVLRLKGLFG